MRRVWTLLARQWPTIVAAIVALSPATYALSQTAGFVPPASQQFLDNNGNPLASGKVYMYVPSSTTAKTTWQDYNQSSANTNPITLDSAGRAKIFGIGNYRQIVKTSTGTTIYDANVASGATSSTIYTDVQPIGTILPYAGTTAPTNYLFAYGQAISRTTYSDLLSAITISDATATCTNTSTTMGGFADTSQFKVGAAIEASCLSPGTTIATITSTTTITVSAAATASDTVTARVFPFGNGNGSTTFNVPDMRGVVPAGRDNIGGSAASRLTNTYCTGAAGALGLGSLCGSQSTTLLQANLPNVSLTTTIASGQGAHTHAPATGSNFITITGVNTVASGANFNYNTGGTATASATLPEMTGTTPTGGSDTAFSNVPPVTVVNYIIKYQTSAGETSGVISFGGMTGDITCGSGLTCADGEVSVTSPGGVTDIGGMTGSIACGSNITCTANTISVSGGVGLGTVTSVDMTVPSQLSLSGNPITTSGTLALTLNGATGSGGFVLQTSPTITSPTLTTPVLGVATATSINKVTLTAPATGATLTIANGKTLTASNSLTLAGTDSTTMTFPSSSASIAALNLAQTFTKQNTFTCDTNCTQIIDANGTGSVTPLTGAVLQLLGNNSSSALLEMDSFGGMASFTGRRANGTLASKTAILSGDILMSMSARGTYDTTNYSSNVSGRVSITATENWDVNSLGAKISFLTTANASNAAATERAYIDSNGLSLSGATSGQTTITPEANASGTWSLPAATDTFVGLATSGTLTNKTWNGATITVPYGGTGQTSFTANLPLIGDGASAVTQGAVSGNTIVFATIDGTLTPDNCIKSDASGNLVDAGSTCGGGGGGSPAGSSTYVQYNTSGAFDASAALTFNTNTLKVGVAASSTGILQLTGATGGTLSLRAPTSFSDYTLILPATVGTAGLPVLSGGAGAAQTYGTITGNTTEFATATGSFTNGNCVATDADHNLVDAGGACNSAPGGSDTQVQFNNTGAFDGSANLTWVSPALTIGAAGSTTGQLKLTGSTSGTITIAGQAAAGTYNFNLPTTAGTAGDLLLSGGGSGTAMAWLADVATGSALISGGVGANPSYGKITSSHLNITTTTCTDQFLTEISATATGTCTSPTLAGAQFANQGTTTTVLHGNASGNPSWGAVALATDVSGTLPVGNGGTGATTFTANLPLIGNGTSAIAQGTVTSTNGATLFATFSGTATAGDCVKIDANGNLTANGAACGTSSPGGSNSYVQYNNAGSFGGVAGFTFNGTAAVSLGVAATSTGSLLLANGAGSGKTITIQNNSATAADFNFNLPATAGTSGQVLTSAAGGSSPMTWTTLAAVATSGSASDLSTGTLAVARGGTNIASYTAGDTLYASGTTTLTKLGIGTSGYLLGSNGSTPSWVGFVQAGTGAATRTWQNKAREIFSAGDFGVTCDGSTDDTSNLQAAITAANTAGGAIVRVQAGTCIFTSLTLSASVELVGQGRGVTTLKLKNSSGGGGITASGANARVASLTLDGNYTNGNGTGVAIGMSGGQFILEDTEVKNWGQVALNITASSGYIIRNNYVHDNDNVGLYIGAVSTTIDNIAITGNYFLQQAQHGIVIGGFSGGVQTNIKIASNTVVSSGYTYSAGGGAIWVLDGSRYVTISDNVVHDNAGDQISVGAQSGGTSVKDISITGNVSYNSLYNVAGTDLGSGMVIYDAENVTVVGNVLYHNAAAGISAVGPTNVIMSDNIIYNNTQPYNPTFGRYPGIWIWNDGVTGAPSNIIVANNRIYDDQATKTQNYAVLVQAGTNIFVYSNYLTTGTDGILGDTTGGVITLGNYGVDNTSQTFPTVTATTSFVMGNTSITSAGIVNSTATNIFGAEINTGSGVSTGSASIELGGQRTGDGYAFFDFHATSGSDYEARFIRSGGANGDFGFTNTGSGLLTFNSIAGQIAFCTNNCATQMYFSNTGGLYVGATSDPGAGGLRTSAQVQADTYVSVGTKIRAAGTAPAVTSCGTTPTISGSDLAGMVTTGTGTPTSCTVTFNAAYSSEPYCIVHGKTQSQVTAYTSSTTALVVTTTATNNVAFIYHCYARSAG